MGVELDDTERVDSWASSVVAPENPDEETDSWTGLRPLPSGRGHHARAVDAMRARPQHESASSDRPPAEDPTSVSQFESQPDLLASPVDSPPDGRSPVSRAVDVASERLTGRNADDQHRHAEPVLGVTSGPSHAEAPTDESVAAPAQRAVLKPATVLRRRSVAESTEPKSASATLEHAPAVPNVPQHEATAQPSADQLPATAEPSPSEQPMPAPALDEIADASPLTDLTTTDSPASVRTPRDRSTSERRSRRASRRTTVPAASPADAPRSGVDLGDDIEWPQRRAGAVEVAALAIGSMIVTGIGSFVIGHWLAR